ncbi:hypothetical protein ER308_16585 [Egibacter rhizosphaerae]|uniref:Uncharacterized protein n=1 Tax=Egibacter rhizosphaerae TaxID=1670831 RepID=A0A411YIT0_9ACTN|nr:hypothetical protein [Egibacter rhizosphaerae]QBI21029.1 hypothetical protein ER308_16585 [Egibacter rhizosphaerae]
MSAELATPRAGVKFASLAVDLKVGEGLFVPWGQTTPYRAEQHAVCTLRGRHAVPDPECSCGFYATDTPTQLLDLLRPSVSALAGMALLDAEFGGVELAGPDGIRAAEQRVLGAAVLAWCPLCPLDEDLPAPPAGLFAADTRLPRGLLQVVALCEGHAALSADARELSLADVSGLLRTEVTWASRAVHEGLLGHMERRWLTRPRRGPVLADREVRHLRMGLVGFVAMSALRLDPVRGELWIDATAPAPQRALRDDAVAIKKRVGPGYQLLVPTDRTAHVDQQLHHHQQQQQDETTPRSPREQRIERVWGLRRMPRLARTLGAIPVGA